MIIVYPRDIEEDQRPVSSAIRKKIKNNPYGAIIESFEGMKKTRDRWGDVEVERSYYTVDIDLSGAEINAISLGESAVFDKIYDGVGIEKAGREEDRRELERIFMETYPKANSAWDHAEIIENDVRLGGEYHIYPLWLYRHTEEAYELSPRCRWDSGAVGCIAIRKDSKIMPEEIVKELNAALNAPCCEVA